MNAAASPRELLLIDRAAMAYKLARREVFDLRHHGLAPLSARQSQVLVDLEIAEGDLRRFRSARTTAVPAPERR